MLDTEHQEPQQQHVNNGQKDLSTNAIVEREGIAGKKEQKRKKRKKRKQLLRPKKPSHKTASLSKEEEAVEVEYVSAQPWNESDPNFEEFKRIFSHFATAEELTRKDAEQRLSSGADENSSHAIDLSTATDEQLSELVAHNVEEQIDLSRFSKKKQKKMRQISVAHLKATVSRPDVVEVHDVTAPDPKLLVYLKTMRNTVPVPRHWSQKRKYLQGKRGIEKPPFRLPDFIQATGIQDVRESYRAKEDEKKVAQKMRERIRPKMGKMDIDFQILHDAFFKYQTKPKVTIFGDIYYEGRENEIKLLHLKPGFLSERLRSALGMPAGAPPPWLINMQRYGPPPSYPGLKIPGLNAPIPEGASWGYHPGGWGRPPVDEAGRPLYGDVYRRKDNEMLPEEIRQRELMLNQYYMLAYDEVPMEKGKYWGAYEEPSEPLPPQQSIQEARKKELEEEEEEEKKEDHKIVAAPVTTTVAAVPPPPALATLVPPHIVPSEPVTKSIVETPEVINLRKVSAKEQPAPVTKQEPEDSGPKVLYQVLEQKETHVGAKELMGSSYKYVVPGTVAMGDGASRPLHQIPQPEDSEELQKRKREFDEQEKKKKKFKF